MTFPIGGKSNEPLNNKTMEKTITLTSDEISSITLAIYDKVMNLSQAVLICGAEITPNAQKRIENLKAIALKLNGVEY